MKQAAPFIWFKGMLDWEKQLSFMPRLDDEVSEPAPSLAAIASPA